MRKLQAWDASGEARLIIQIGPDSSAQGGIAAVLSSYASYGTGFRKLGYILVFIASCGRSGRNGLRTFLAAWCQLLWLLLRRDVHLVHIHSSIKGSLLRKSAFALTCALSRKSYVIHLHSGAFAQYYSNLSTLTQILVRTILRKAVSVICLSSHAREQLTSMKLVAPEKCRLVYNGIDDPMTEVRREEVPARPITVTFLGKLSESKGLVTLLEALAALPEAAPEYTLLVGGTGDTQTFFEWVRWYGLGEKVAYKGWVTGESKASLLADTEIFVLPSRSEGFPVAIVEAMAYGTAVISTLIPGVIDAIRQGQDGVLVNADDVDGLRDALWMLLNDAGVRGRLGASARKRFLDRFTIQQTAQSLRLVYDGVGS